MSLRNIAASLLLALGVATLTAVPAVAQTASAPAATAASDAAAPAPAAPAPLAASTTKETIDNPYGLSALWAQGDFVAKGTLIILVIMSMGSWYILITKLYES
ncbi:MAG TPA: MotA/TolQ/ExbB proton channel family protein, partial [Albitalea sp.]